MEIYVQKPNGHPEIETRLTKRDIDKVELRHAGKVLTDTDIVNLVINGDFSNLDTVVQWLGSKISDSQRPISRFSAVVAKNFDGLEEEQKEKFLLNGIRIALGDFHKRFWVPNYFSPKLRRDTHIATLKRFELIDKEKGKNVEKLLGCFLSYTNNDLELARGLLKKINLTDVLQKGELRIFTYQLYRSQPDPLDSAATDEKPKKEQSVKNPKTRLLAFWLEIDVGKLGSRSSSFDELLENIYPKSDAEIKTQIMIFIKESLFTRKVPEMKYFIIERLLAKDSSQNNDPDSPLAKESDVVRTVLRMDRLLKETKGGKINAEDLVVLLEKHSFLINYVTEKELDTTLDKIKDHGLAARIIKLIKSKKQQDLASQGEALQD